MLDLFFTLANSKGNLGTLKTVYRKQQKGNKYISLLFTYLHFNISAIYSLMCRF